MTATTPAAVPLAPTGIRIASTLCYVAGILTLLVVAAVGIPALSQPEPPLLFLGANLVGGVLACVAGFIVRRQLRTGGLLVVLAWAFPALVSFLTKAGIRSGGLFLLVAMLFTLLNWKHLK
jgi:hypothetical protein